jgi:phosphatidyl-myo-inositol dimannoside synthase
MTDAFGGYGGIAQYNRDLLDALTQNPLIEAIRALVRVAPEPFSPGNRKLRQLAPVESRLGYAAKAVVEALAFRPTLVLSGHLYHGPLAQFIARLLRVPLVSQLHGTEIWGPQRSRDLAALRASDMVLCVSQDTASHLRRQLGTDHEGIRVIANTVGPQFVPQDRQASRLKFQIGDEATILTVARLDGRDGYKGHDRVIRVLPQLAAGGRPVSYLVAGTGPDRPRLEAIAAALGVSSQVRFLGKVADADLPALYSAADVFALPSTGEGFGIVYLEAMACGTPAIGLTVGGAPDALCHGELGTCVAAAEFQQALANLLNAPAPDRETLSAAVHARFGKAAFAARVNDAFGALH